MCKKVTIVLPCEVLEILRTLSQEKNVTMSSITSASIEYYNWLNTQKKEGFEVKSIKKENSITKERIIEIV